MNSGGERGTLPWALLVGVHIGMATMKYGCSLAQLSYPYYRDIYSSTFISCSIHNSQGMETAQMSTDE